MTFLELRPHPAESHPAGLGLQVRLSRSRRHLSVRFQLLDPGMLVLLPEQVNHPERRDGLWHGTCFELFMAREGGPEYHELNLSPSGHWNLYHFSDYRRAAAGACLPDAMPFHCSRMQSGCTVELELALQPLGLTCVTLDLGICATVCARDGSLSHWALRHANPSRPDFHLRQSMGLTLPPATQDEAEL